MRIRPDSVGFRTAWDAALDLSIRRLTDECFSRVLNGVPVPHFYRGEQVGEHRRYDNRLAMFLLRYRDPLRYAATLDQMVYTGQAEAAMGALAFARHRVLAEVPGIPDTADAPAPSPSKPRLSPRSAPASAGPRRPRAAIRAPRRSKAMRRPSAAGKGGYPTNARRSKP